MNEEIAKKGWAFVFIAAAVLLVYANSYDVPWHLDDFPNIVQNKRLHLKSLTPGAAFDTFFAAVGADEAENNRVYRPVAMLSFGLNWYFGKDDVTGYHAVNIAFHIVTAFLLYLIVCRLLLLPGTDDRYHDSAHAIGLLSAFLWALHPIQVQAVTYIVQRMAVLAGMFYLAGIFAFVRGRTALSGKTAAGWFVCCGLFFLLGVGSKENAITLPAALLLVEFIFFRHAHSKKIAWLKLMVILTVAAILVLAILRFYLGQNPFSSIMAGYAERPFTLAQRAMTQPRVLLFYLSQFFYPVLGRFSPVHDFQISTSLLHPWTTLPAIIGCFALIVSAVSLRRRYPLAAFAVLFYFLTHVVESSVLPLEMTFEHRNYLSSVFLFVPIAALAAMFVGRKQYRRWTGVIVGAVSIFLFGLGLATMERNRIWKSEATLWADADTKAPKSARPKQQLAAYFKARGDLDTALKLYKTAMLLYDERPAQSMALGFNNMGGIYASKHDYELALQYYRRALAAQPDHYYAHYNMALTYLRMNRLADAEKQLDELIAKHPEAVDALNLKGFVLLKQQKPESAITCFSAALGMTHENPAVWINLGIALVRAGHVKRAEWILRQAVEKFEDEITLKLAMVEAGLESEDDAEIALSIDRLLKSVPLARIQEALKILRSSENDHPLNGDLLSSAIAKQLMRISKSFESITAE